MAAIAIGAVRPMKRISCGGSAKAGLDQTTAAKSSAARMKTAPPGVRAPRSRRVASDPSVSRSVRDRASMVTVVLMSPP